MKLDTSNMRYMTPDDFRVLQAVEQGSRNHEVVPTTTIHQISGMRSASGTNRSIGDLAKLKLVSRMRNIKYDGFRLTYNGFDYLGLKAMLNRDTIYSIGNVIGVGKESDVYRVSAKDGTPRVLKIHRLGRTSFTTVKNNRDYLKRNQTGNWMFLSLLAANKEYQFMSLLHSKGFTVPEPFDNSRHMILMELINGYPMRRMRKHKNLPKLYSDLMKFIVKLANHGLIHCDYNEFNIMIKDEVTDSDDCGFIVIDFPQCVSIQHQDAEYYFKRDVDCIRKFFEKKLKYVPHVDESMLDVDGYGEGYKYAYPDFNRDVTRCDNLDELVQASGFSKKHPGDRRWEEAAEQMRKDQSENIEEQMDDNELESMDGPSDFSDYSDYSEEDEEEEESGEEEDLEKENERIVEALSSGVANLKVDSLGNYVLEE